MERRRLNKEGKDGGGLYFDDPAKHVECIPTGCELLNRVLGGGWAIGKVSNIVGDKSTGKTLLAIEAMANFYAAYPGTKSQPAGLMRYKDAEAAFDKGYAATLGLPADRVEFGDDSPCNTVEDLFNDVDAFLKRLKKNQRGLYILDSLDALSNATELEGVFGENGYGMQKPKAMSEMFRRLIRLMEEKHCHVAIISQVRDAIGAVYGRKTTRSGGRALDFYASQVVFLAPTGKIYKTISGVKRPVGVNIIAKCDKNKVGMPYRECEFPIMFGFGIDDTVAGVNWLIEIKRTDALGDGWGKDDAEVYIRGLSKLSSEEYHAERQNVARIVRKLWIEVETGFAPKQSKY